MARIMLSGLLAAWVGYPGQPSPRSKRLAAPASGRRRSSSPRGDGPSPVGSAPRGSPRGYRSYYYFLAALGLKVQDLGLAILDLTIQQVPITERLTLALDDTPTKRHGPEIEAAGRHHNPTPGPSGSKTLYGHNWVVLARLVKHAHSHIIGLPLWASLYVRRVRRPRAASRRHALGIPDQAGVGRHDDPRPRPIR